MKLCAFVAMPFGMKEAGDIRADMFQELLIADLAVADLTPANPNV